MLLNKLILLVGAITKDGGISADYTMEIIIGICGFLIITLVGLAFNSFNNNIKRISDGFDKFQADFHKFVEHQSGLNAKFEEKTKDL